MDSGSPDYQEALSNLSTRLKSLQVRTALYIVALRSTRQCLPMKRSNNLMRHDLHWWRILLNFFFYLKCKKRFTTTSTLPLVLCYECGANLDSLYFVLCHRRILNSTSWRRIKIYYPSWRQWSSTRSSRRGYWSSVWMSCKGLTHICLIFFLKVSSLAKLCNTWTCSLAAMTENEQPPR